MQTEKERRLLTPQEVGAMFRVNPRTVNRWSKNGTLGKLTDVRTPTGHRRYWEDEVLALLAGRVAVEHSTIGVCTLAPNRPRADVGLCRACIDLGLFDALVAGLTP